VDESRPVEVQGGNLDAAGDPDTCIGVGEQTWNSEPLDFEKVSCKLWRGVRSFGRINVIRGVPFAIPPHHSLRYGGR